MVVASATSEFLKLRAMLSVTTGKHLPWKLCSVETGNLIQRGPNVVKEEYSLRSSKADKLNEVRVECYE